MINGDNIIYINSRPRIILQSLNSYGIISAVSYPRLPFVIIRLSDFFVMPEVSMPWAFFILTHLSIDAHSQILPGGKPLPVVCILRDLLHK